ncbi:hypothetical protein GGF46_003609 [Coemansia sp. RSA 552]|nr:hypothetical protein GGF46_003609 [Coemansia sp. RSA 552]
MLSLVPRRVLLSRAAAVRGYSSTATATARRLGEINQFWFGESDRLHSEGKASFQRWWFEPGAAIDQEIRTRFGKDFEQVVGGAKATETSGAKATETASAKAMVDEAKETADGTLALIILLDQMGRNMFRGSPQAFAGDGIARSLAMYMVRRKFHLDLRLVKRSFVYMPLMHAEDMEAQDLSVQLYSELAEELRAPDEDSRNNDFGEFAKMHQAVIRDFGRFPSRNKALGRQSTPEEEAWLKTAPF